MGRILVAVDPSINCSGVAVFHDGCLVSASAVKLKSKLPLLSRVNIMARNIARDYEWNELVVEWPQVYTHGGNDRNDLLGLAGICGALAAMSEAPFVAYLPREWAGNVPKSKKGDPKKSPRGVRIERRLSVAELKVWSAVKSHDVIDAIGIGMHHLGRMERKRVFPGAS